MPHELPFLNTYEAAARATLESLVGRSLNEAELARLSSVVASSVCDRRAVVHNPRTDKSAETSLGKIAGWLTDRKPHAPIVTGHGTLFRPHAEFRSVVGEMVDFLMKQRKVAKNRMFDLMRAGRSPNEPEVKSLDQQQKIMKLLANSWYGAQGEKGFMFYNDAVGPAITFNGQLIISATMFGFEAFLAGNLWLRNENEMARHVSDCLRKGAGRDPQAEWGEHPELVGALEESDAVETLAKASAPGWDSRSYAASLVAGRSKADLLSIVLRGNPYLFMTFPRAYELLSVALSGEIREADPDKIAKHHPEGKAALDALGAGMLDWVAVHWMPSDLPRMVAKMERRTVIASDTDSTFLNLHPWMQWVGENFDISTATEEEKLTCLNAMVYLLRLSSDYQMGLLTRNLGVPEAKRKIINFKSEFVISRMVLTDGKKNYMALLRFQEGARIVGDKVELKGLAMKKTTVARSTGKFFEKSIEEKILRSGTINRVGLVRDIVELEERIRRSLADGGTEYSSPASVGSVSSYANPFAMPVVRGMAAWNAAEKGRPIREGDRVKLFRTVVNTDVNQLVAQAEQWPEGSSERLALMAIVEAFFGASAPVELSTNGLNWLAIPGESGTVPLWARQLIDIESVLTANTSVMNPVLEAIGVRVVERPEPAIYSNLLRF